METGNWSCRSELLVLPFGGMFFDLPVSILDFPFSSFHLPPSVASVEIAGDSVGKMLC
jgi:hypothetical protein